MGSGFDLVLALVGFGLIAVVPTLIIPFFFAPRKPSPVKSASYESGQAPIGEGRVTLMMQYYVYVLMFVVFDVAIMFLFAWGIGYVSIGIQGAFVMGIFLAILFIPIGYALHLADKRELW